MYELIKGDENGIVFSNKNLFGLEEGHREKEMKSAPQLRPASVSTGDKESTAVLVLGGGKDTAAKRRLVSLDVFHGITVADRDYWI